MSDTKPSLMTYNTFTFKTEAQMLLFRRIWEDNGTALFDKLKKRWGLNSNTQVLIIFIVFGITGSGSLYVSTPVMDYLSISSDNIILRIIIVTFIYQFILLIVAFIFGQFKWFWNFFYKKLFKKIGLIK